MGELVAKYLRPIVPLRQSSVNLSIKLFHIIYSHTSHTARVYRCRLVPL